MSTVFGREVALIRRVRRGPEYLVRRVGQGAIPPTASDSEWTPAGGDGKDADGVTLRAPLLFLFRFFVRYPGFKIFAGFKKCVIDGAMELAGGGIVVATDIGASVINGAEVVLVQIHAGAKGELIPPFVADKKMGVLKL